MASGYEPHPLPSSLSGVPFRVADAVSAGVSRSRLRRADLAAPFHGVRVPTEDAADLDLVRAYRPLLPAHHAFARSTAARIHGMRLPRRLDDRKPHVVALGGRAPESRGVVGHRTDREPAVVLVDGVPVTDPVSTWLDLAGEATVNELVQLGDALVRRIHPLASMEHLTAGVRSRRGARGIRKLRAALALVRPRTDSSAETTLRLIICALGYPEPTVNAALFDRFGEQFTHGDLLHPRERTLWEFDGFQHFTDPRQYGKDVQRLNEIVAAGYHLIRVTARQLNRPAVLQLAMSSPLGAPSGGNSPSSGPRRRPIASTRGR